MWFIEYDSRFKMQAFLRRQSGPLYESLHCRTLCCIFNVFRFFFQPGDVLLCICVSFCRQYGSSYRPTSSTDARCLKVVGHDVLREHRRSQSVVWQRLHLMASEQSVRDMHDTKTLDSMTAWPEDSWELRVTVACARLHFYGYQILVSCNEHIGLKKTYASKSPYEGKLRWKPVGVWLQRGCRRGGGEVRRNRPVGAILIQNGTSPTRERKTTGKQFRHDCSCVFLCHLYSTRPFTMDHTWEVMCCR